MFFYLVMLLGTTYRIVQCLPVLSPVVAMGFFAALGLWAVYFGIHNLQTIRLLHANRWDRRLLALAVLTLIHKHTAILQNKEQAKSTPLFDTTVDEWRGYLGMAGPYSKEMALAFFGPPVGIMLYLKLACP